MNDQSQTEQIPPIQEIKAKVREVLKRRDSNTTMRDLMLARELLNYSPPLRVEAIEKLRSDGVVTLAGPIGRDDTAVELVSKT